MLKEDIAIMIEERVHLATRQKISMKANKIAQLLGKPIISQINYAEHLPDVWQLNDQEYEAHQILDADDYYESQHGYVFDGLRCGINLWICCTYADETLLEVKVTYNGYIVFMESDGQIQSYAPFSAWEDALNMFYEAAVVRDNKRKQQEKAERAQRRQKNYQQFWQRLKMLWGWDDNTRSS